MRFVVALDLKPLWSDLLLCCCAATTRIHPDWHKGESLEHGCRCTAAAVLVYTCCTVLVAARLSGCLKITSAALLDRFVCL